MSLEGDILIISITLLVFTIAGLIFYIWGFHTGENRSIETALQKQLSQLVTTFNGLDATINNTIAVTYALHEFLKQYLPPKNAKPE